ncbi:hypothetical protein [Mucilaginibacter sp.]
MENELAKAISAIKAENLTNQDKEILLFLFNKTDNIAIANSIALIFADAKFQAAIPSVIKKIFDKNFYNYNGTLIYSLQDFDTKKYFIKFIKILCEQGYEARLQAYEVIEKDINLVTKRMKTVALAVLKRYAETEEFDCKEESYPDSRIHFITDTINLMSR